MSEDKKEAVYASLWAEIAPLQRLEDSDEVEGRVCSNDDTISGNRLVDLVVRANKGDHCCIGAGDSDVGKMCQEMVVVLANCVMVCTHDTHAHIHTYTHTHIRAYTHTRIHTYTHIHIHAYTYTRIHT